MFAVLLANSIVSLLNLHSDSASIHRIYPSYLRSVAPFQLSLEPFLHLFLAFFLKTCIDHVFYHS